MSKIKRNKMKQIKFICGQQGHDLEHMNQFVVNTVFQKICNIENFTKVIEKLICFIGEYYHLSTIMLSTISESGEICDEYIWNEKNQKEEDGKIGQELIFSYGDEKGKKGILRIYDRNCRMLKMEDIHTIDALTTLIFSRLLTASAYYTLHEQYEYSRNYDSLTGLPMLQKMKEEKQKLLDENTSLECVVIYVDIENFRFINETLGEKQADQVLIDFATFLTRYTYAIGAASRVQADRFVIFTRFKKEELVIRTIRYINEQFRDKIRSRFASTRVRINAGICRVNGGEDLSKAIEYANMARKSIKGNPNICCRMYTQTLKEDMNKEYEITNNMEQALYNQEFVVYLQPKVDLITNQIAGAEALVRWKKGAEEILPPSQFIPIFEKNGFILDIDYYIFEEVCKILSRWKKTQKNIVPIAVNVSRMHLGSMNFIYTLLQLTDKYEIPRNWIELELMESIFYEDTETIKNQFNKLQELGFIVSIDDFGSGYSSLNMLKDIHADYIKLDKEFFREGAIKREEKIIITSIVNMAKQLNVGVISEGVENEEQVEFLKEIKCDQAQGYYYSKAIELEAFEKLMM